MVDALVLDSRVSGMLESYWATCCHPHYTEETLSPAGPIGQDQELGPREVQHASILHKLGDRQLSQHPSARTSPEPTHTSWVVSILSPTVYKYITNHLSSADLFLNFLEIDAHQIEFLL